MENNKIISILGTSIFHGIILLLLIFCYLKPAISAPIEDSFGGVPVMFGNVADAGGNDEPFGRGNNAVADNSSPMPNATDVTTTVTPPVKTPPTTSNSQLATQDMDETHAIKVAAEKKAEAERREQETIAAEARRKKAEEDRIAQERAQAGQKIGSEVAGLFGNGSGTGSRGDGTGEGTQGVETGNASFGEKTGIGGVGGGFVLGNRKLGAGGLIRPDYGVNAEGVVKVTIRVNSKGSVIEATVAQGTTASNPTLVKEALRAARRTRFNEISVNKDEIGTITYTFTLN